MINGKGLDFLKCAVEVFPGWVKTMDKYNMDKISHVEFTWRIMPGTFNQARRVLLVGHPGGLEAIVRERTYGVE